MAWETEDAHKACCPPRRPSPAPERICARDLTLAFRAARRSLRGRAPASSTAGPRALQYHPIESRWASGCTLPPWPTLPRESRVSTGRRPAAHQRSCRPCRCLSPARQPRVQGRPFRRCRPLLSAPHPPRPLWRVPALRRPPRQASSTATSETRRCSTIGRSRARTTLSTRSRASSMITAMMGWMGTSTAAEARETRSGPG